MKPFVFFFLFLSSISASHAFEKRYINCPDMFLNKKLLFKTFLDQNGEAKISQVPNKSFLPQKGFTYYSVSTNEINWTRIQYNAWRYAYLVKEKKLIIAYAPISKEDYDRLAKFKNNQKSLDIEKHKFITNKIRNGKAKVLVFRNCKLEKQ